MQLFNVLTLNYKTEWMPFFPAYKSSLSNLGTSHWSILIFPRQVFDKEKTAG